ncbi:MAG: TlpA disulfide reductase family protein [Dysgonomonas sp.]|nr:TlpA disulfide reductase family protein [Dysgonomonas sp.]
MKKLLLTIVILFSIIGIAYASNVSTIEGTWNKRTPRIIKLFKVEDGTLKEIASTTLANDNKFYFGFAPDKEAFYVIGLSQATALNNYTFYFKPGDKLNVVINQDNTYNLIGNENTLENKEMERWHNFVFPLEDKAVYYAGKQSTYVDYFPLLDEKLESLGSYNQEYKGNSIFNENFKALQKYDMLYYALQFLSTPRMAHPQGEDFSDYYLNMDIADITSSSKLLEYPYGMGIISRYHMFIPSLKSDDYREEQKKEFRNPQSMLTITLPKIANETIKGEVVLMQTRYIKSYEGFLDFEKKYGQYLVTDSQKDRFKGVVSKVADNKKGQQAIDFKFPDINGKDIALSDFKGKVVYIDVWATWCAPCIKEIPELKKLEEEYHGKDIVFLGVSIDRSKDKDKWKTFLEKREMKGIQIFAGDKAQKELKDPYKIATIPRFILVGKDGKLISGDAPRPSSTEIRLLLDSTLK